MLYLYFQMDSVFQLDKPHDLMAMLQQEDRTREAELLREELFQKKVEFEHRTEDKDSGTLIEEKLYATDPDCLKVGRKVTQMAIFESTHSEFEFYGVDFGMLDKAITVEREPNCSHPSLEFSMQTFEHLSGVQNRNNLTMDPETTLSSLISAEMDLKTYGNWVASNLELNSTSWISFNLATLYYRIAGNAREALECCRRALHFSPREHRAIALVDMGNILTHTHHQEDAILVLHAAVDHMPSDPIAHYTLANSYALIGDLNR